MVDTIETTTVARSSITAKAVSMKMQVRTPRCGSRKENAKRSRKSVETCALVLYRFQGLATSEDCGGLAQLGERLPCKQEVSGSIPLISTTYGSLAQSVRALA